MKFSWSMFWLISTLLLVAKLIIVLVGFMCLEAMVTGWGVWIWKLILPFMVFLFPTFIFSLFSLLVAGSDAGGLLAITIIGELFVTFAYGALFTRLFFVFVHIPKINKKSVSETNISETY